ncbi:hypothetical protein O181_084099 [Austropuccinia psidii MF-1]|uniref:Uncharacterized protein n=1 Tax=Austropuccinia psidii MF-1 TaxID=1389203 RepID=A0A9Q3FSU0_9BASI|nr:hypothetical protein [Austropuccinia psidii MF-1]
MEIDRKKNFRLSEWALESGTLDSGNTDSEGTETPVLGISSSELHNEFFMQYYSLMPSTNSVASFYNSFKQNTGVQTLNPSWKNPG